MSYAAAVNRSWSDSVTLVLGQWFFTGRSPIAPGTVGSLFTIPLFLVARTWSDLAYWGLTGIVSLGGTFISDRCATLLGEKDPSSVVIDEVAGVLIAMGCVMHASAWFWALAWSLFRLLDIAKPWLIDRVQYLEPKGLGIMADDLLAGLCAGGIALACAQLPIFG